MLKESILKQHKFTFDDQKAFAKLSGDYNPLHIDIVAARRYIFGQPIVNGVHLLLRALDNLLKGETTPLSLSKVKAVFRKPIGVDEEVSYSLISKNKNHIEIELSVDETVAVIITVGWTYSRLQTLKQFSTDSPKRHNCKVLSPKEASVASGNLNLYLDVEYATQLFPNLMKIIPSLLIAEIITTTRLVGMKCPGFHSVYSELDLTFVTKIDKPPILTYEVTKFIAQYRLLQMKVYAPGMVGMIKAFIRPLLQEQESFINLSKQVANAEFKEQRALIIGGSRGLGEVTTKLLCAGGAKVKFTYHLGRIDANRIKAEIISGGSYADCVSFDVLDHKKDLLSRLGEKEHKWIPTHLYYFATPFILSSTKEYFSSKLFQRFCDFYVTGFYNTIRELIAQGLQNIFYPSSVFIDRLPKNMAEYISAKMAGEILCTFLEKNSPIVTIYKPF